MNRVPWVKTNIWVEMLEIQWYKSRWLGWKVKVSRLVGQRLRGAGSVVISSVKRGLKEGQCLGRVARLHSGGHEAQGVPERTEEVRI